MASGGAESEVNGVEHSEEFLQAQAEEEKAAKEFGQQCAQELKQKLDSLGKGFQHSAEDKFLHLESRYEDHSMGITKTAQTDVLRLNKITRDVSRDLGADWKEVFKFIMAGIDKDVIDAEIVRIEKEKPFMQGYKAIQRWRDLKSDTGVDVDKLIEALQIHDRAELADHVQAILAAEGDELLKIGKTGTGIGRGGASASGAAGAAEGDEAAAAKPTRRIVPEDTSGRLNDRTLLAVAKKIGPTWFELAQLLGLSEEEITDVKGSEGATYQGAFKVMWLWRDHTLDQDIDQRQVLTEALKASNLEDVAQLL